ncbi:11593_t:CDS:2, partial [Gigaspora margarita]
NNENQFGYKEEFDQSSNVFELDELTQRQSPTLKRHLLLNEEIYINIKDEQRQSRATFLLHVNVQITGDVPCRAPVVAQFEEGDIPSSSMELMESINFDEQLTYKKPIFKRKMCLMQHIHIHAT